MAGGKYKEKSKNNIKKDKKATTEATTEATTSDSIKNKKVENSLEKNFQTSLKVYGLMCFIAAIIMVGLHLITGQEIYKYIIKLMSNNISVFIVIVIYYIYMYILNRDKENGKILVFNFFCIISVYNILLLYNPLKMEELKDDYIISNIFYFYISFLIVSFEFQICRMLRFIIDLSFGLVNSIKTRPYIIILLYFITIALISFFGSIFIKNDVDFKNYISNLSLIDKTLIISVISYNLWHLTIRPKKNYVEVIYQIINGFLNKIEKKIENGTNWILDIIKIEKINEVVLIDKNEKLNYLHAFILITVKFIVLYFFIMFYNNNLYYAIYTIKNDGYCKNLNGINDQTNIVKLKNNNVLIMNKKDDINYFQETKCEKELKTIKVIEKKINYESFK